MPSRPTIAGLAPIVPALLVLVVLSVFVAVDPPTGFTASTGPFTDEAWDLMNARNLVLFGHWSTDDWNLHLVNVPFSVAESIVFRIAGIGIVQGRLVSIVATALTVLALGAGLRRALGRGPALLAAVAFGSAGLVLYYGRLAFLEPMVALGLTVGTVGTLRATDANAGRWGILSGMALALAVGTKPSALFAVAGLLVGVGIVHARSSGSARRWLAGAATALAVAALGWILLIGLPNLAAVRLDLRIWASEPLPKSLTGLIARVLKFPVGSDNMLLLAAPLLVGAAVGVALARRHWAALTSETRGLVGAAIGSIVVGYAVLAIVPYRPNRYEVPLLPALAILTAVGWATLRDVIRRRGPRSRSLAAAVVAAGLALPGIVSFASWMSVTDSRLPGIQAEVRSILPAGATAEGMYAPMFALDAPVVTLVSRPSVGVNGGDLYLSRHVRWYIGGVRTRPAWASLHPEAWAGRHERMCAPWGAISVCVWELP
jgi:4-amino-4-deoxy-L-arabinose transferase-like glycosyltransferase